MTDGLRFVVDSVTDGLALFVFHDDDQISFHFPVSLLPEGVREGDHLRLAFSIDAAARAEERARAEELLKELTQGQDPNQTDFQL